jgi:hexokinase
MPGSRGQVSAEDFFSQIADLTAPLIEEAGQIDGIGFCFSYSIEITKDSDAVLISFSKEVDAPEVLGRRLGAGLKEALAARKVRIPDRIVLLNDAAATLLSGIAEMPPDAGLGKRNELFELSCGPVIGFILGTGFNTAYLEKIIPKIGYNSVDSSQIVVCETCRFHPRVLGYLDREFDATTKSPGTYVQEKVSAGAYLGPLTLFVCKRAIKDGILQFRRSGELEALNTLQTADLNSFLKAPFNGEAPLSVLFDAHEGDALASLYYLASIIVERGSLLSAAILAATIERMDAGFNPFAPVRIAVEGTTYLAFKGMRESLESRLHVMLNQKKPRSCIIAPVQQASLFGAAIAALS